MKKQPCWRNAINKEGEKFLLVVSMSLINYFSDSDNIYKKQFLARKDIKRVYRGLLRIVTKKNKVIIGRDADLIIEKYRASNFLAPKKTTRRILK